MEKMKKMMIMFLCLVIPVITYSDEFDYYQVTGKGSRKRFAIADAWRGAMMKFLQQNVDIDLLESNSGKVEK